MAGAELQGCCGLTSCWAVASLSLMEEEKGPGHQHEGPQEQGEALGNTTRCSISAGEYVEHVWSTQQEPVWLLPGPAGVHWSEQPVPASSIHPLGVAISSATQLKSLHKITSTKGENQNLKQH